MPDQLNLSLWVRGYDSATMLRHFEELLRVFPFSRLRPGIGAARIYAVAFQEPPLLEQAFPEEVDVGTAIGICREFENSDGAYIIEGWWELWRYEQDWQLRSAPVVLTCFGPEFENDMGDHLRLELGAEADFLPHTGTPQGVQKARSNLAGLVRLAREIGDALPIERRNLWSDSGENFVERLDEALVE